MLGGGPLGLTADLIFGGGQNLGKLSDKYRYITDKKDLDGTLELPLVGLFAHEVRKI